MIPFWLNATISPSPEFNRKGSLFGPAILSHILYFLYEPEGVSTIVCGGHQIWIQAVQICREVLRTFLDTEF